MEEPWKVKAGRSPGQEVTRGLIGQSFQDAPSFCGQHLVAQRYGQHHGSNNALPLSRWRKAPPLKQVLSIVLSGCRASLFLGLRNAPLQPSCLA